MLPRLLLAFPLLVAVHGLCMNCLLAATDHPNILVEDSFALDANHRIPGADLFGQKAERGEAAWVTEYTRFSEGGAIVGAGDATVFSASARISVSPPAGEVLTVTAETVVDTSDWVGVGFYSGGDGVSLSENGALWVLLRPSGEWTIFANRTLAEVASGKIGGFDPRQECTLGLSWNTNDQTANAFVRTKEKVVFLGAIDKGTLSTSAVESQVVKTAGFQINASKNTVPGVAMVDRFAVTSEASPR